MFKKLSLMLVTIIVLGLLIPGIAMAEGPTGDFAVVQGRVAEWLASSPNPVIAADAVYANLNDGNTANDPFILSVRKPDAYAKGHVPGAINIPWNQVAKPESLAKLPADKPIVDYCYTGHTGQVAMTSLNLLGYNVTNMKFGMMGWTKNDDVLATGRFYPDAVPDYPTETTINEPSQTYNFPVLNTGASDKQEIIRSAVDAYLSSGRSPVMPASDLYNILNDGDPSNDPVILSVRKPDDYAKGHVPGAINIPWPKLGDPAELDKLPPDKPIVVYCYTGHTGQLATTLLNVMGYQATNMKFGMMGWSKNPNVLALTPFDPATQPDFPVEGTLGTTEAANVQAQATEPAAQATAPAVPTIAPTVAAAEAPAESAPSGATVLIWVYILAGVVVVGIGVYAFYARQNQ